MFLSFINLRIKVYEFVFLEDFIFMVVKFVLNNNFCFCDFIVMKY